MMQNDLGDKSIDNNQDVSEDNETPEDLAELITALKGFTILTDKVFAIQNYLTEQE